MPFNGSACAWASGRWPRVANLPAAGVATLHELGRPFSEAEGPGLLGGLRFDADNTLADTPMVGLLHALGGLLDAARERGSAGGRCGSDLFDVG